MSSLLINNYSNEGQYNLSMPDPKDCKTQARSEVPAHHAENLDDVEHGFCRRTEAYLLRIRRCFPHASMGHRRLSSAQDQARPTVGPTQNARPLRQPQGAGQGRQGGQPRRAGTQGRCGCGAQAVLGRGRACRPTPYAPPPRPPRHRPRPANARPPRPPAAANMNYTYIIRLLLDRRTQATGRPHAGRDPPGLQECYAELHAYSLLRAFCS